MAYSLGRENYRSYVAKFNSVARPTASRQIIVRNEMIITIIITIILNPLKLKKTFTVII